jgi:RsiW-degrading membrane proteinase PrsW (M82 family)
MFAVAMGYYFSLAYFKKSWRDKILSFIMPFLFHGLYDTFLFSMSISGDTVLFLLLLLLIFMIYLVKRSGKAISKHLKSDLEQYILYITPPEICSEDEKK